MAPIAEAPKPKVVTYQDYVFCQNADGSWKPSVLPLLMEDSIMTLKKRQTDDFAALDDTVLLTMAAIKVLQTKYADKKQETRLVVLKGFNYLKTRVGKPQGDIPQLILQVKLNL
jgi:hypothetical protein